TARRAPGSRLPLGGTLGAQPLGLLLALPYVLFLAAVMAWPLIQAVWISFHDYFFTAPAAVVDHPFVGLDNYLSAVTDPQVRQSLWSTPSWDLTTTSVPSPIHRSGSRSRTSRCSW